MKVQYFSVNLFELGGKRSKRKRVATRDHDLLGWDFETKRLDTITEVTNAFIDLLGSPGTHGTYQITW